jgi:uncharacterized phage-associated protein
MPTEVTAQEVADYVIHVAHEAGAPLSNLKLQKILYYAQAWHLAIFDQRLFPETFEAWVHGPVIPELYRKYQSTGWRDIEPSAEKPGFSPELEEFLRELLEEYLPLDAYRLELMTHREDPWIHARNGLPIDAPSNQTIDESDMRDYYRSRMERADHVSQAN